MKLLEIACHAALSASTLMHAPADIKAMLYFIIALCIAAHYGK